MTSPPNRSVQLKAKAAMSVIAATISASSTERTIASAAKAILADFGLIDSWYYECHAFVLLGSRSCLSISGRNYIPAEEPVGNENLVTVDLSPCEEPLWGDYARSFCVEGDEVVESPASPAFVEGLKVENSIHRLMAEFVTPDTSFHQLYEFANDAISTAGFENLDFMGNVGHSIETNRDSRRYAEKGNHQRLGECSCFTFEPHIRRLGGRWGFKHEDIYYFDGSHCIAL